MSQDFTDNVYDSSFVIGTTMENVEKNFAALKSNFSGTSAPSNAIAAQWWADFTNNLLKLRNEADSAWLNVFDLANNKPVITNLSNEITETMMSSTIKDAAAGTYSLRRLGTGAQQACAGNDSRLNTVPDTTISQAKLKTTTGSVTVYGSNSVGAVKFSGALPGGEYGFREKVKVSTANDTIRYLGHGVIESSLTTSFAAPGAMIEAIGSSASIFLTAQERYVQSSGEVHWIFLLKDRNSGLIRKEWEAPDHCCFGNSDDPTVFQHPYGNYDQDKYELIVINPPHTLIRDFKSKAGKQNSILDVIRNDYVIDELSSPAWPTKKVTVGLPQRWEEAWHTGEAVKTIKASIPKPKQAITRVLKKKSL